MKMDRALLTRAAWVAGSLVWALLVFQVALWLTFPSDSMSRWLVYRLVRDGELRAVRVGDRLRFRPGDVAQYLERRPTP